MTLILDSAQVDELNRQVAALEAAEYVAVITDDGRVFARSTADVPETLLALWRAESSMAIPDDAGYAAATTPVALDDL